MTIEYKNDKMVSKPAKGCEYMPKGGKREGAGRKPTGRNRVQITLRTSLEAIEEINLLIPTNESLPKKAEKIFLIGLETLKNKDKDTK